MQRLAAAGLAGAVDARGQGQATGSSREDMSARLQSILADAMVSTEIQDAMAQVRLLTIGLFAAMGTIDPAFKDCLADVLVDMDPGAIQDRAERAKVRMELTRICSAHSICRASHEVGSQSEQRALGEPNAHDCIFRRFLGGEERV